MHSIIILTRTYYKDGNILQKNLLSTFNIFVNRDKYKIGVILDDETVYDHELGNYLIKQNIIDSIYYEPLPENHLTLFQALAYPNMHWGYDRQQWSTFYMDTFVDNDIIGILDSDSTFTSYLTDENIFSKEGKIKIFGIKPTVSMVHWCSETKWFKFKNGAQHENDDIALKFDTVYDCMATNIMPFFFWKTTFQNFRNYISDVWGMSFDDAYKIFSTKPYCQFNIMVNYALRFEPDKYEFIDLMTDNTENISVAQNGCPTSRDTLCGVINSFNVKEEQLSNIIIQSSKVSSFGNVDIHLSYEQLKNDLRHPNNFSYFVNNHCSREEINKHYSNVNRDIDKLSIAEMNNLQQKVTFFLENQFNNIIIKG